MKYFKLLFVIVIFFGFLQGQTKNAKWVLSSQKNYNRLTEEAKDNIETPLFDIIDLDNVKIYSEAMRKIAEDLKRKDSWISRQIKK